MSIVLPANRPPARFYRGGAKLARMRGEADAPTHEPEDWVGSTTLVAGEEHTGRTVLPDGTLLADAVAFDPVAWLGDAHARAFGADTKLLVKLLDAGERLPVHAHPHVSFAREQLGHAHGKSEAWYILDGGTVHLAPTRDITPEELATLVAGQRTDDLLGLLHTVPVSRGDVVYVPPGTLHAIGEGVLMVEVQEPEDLSILLEWDGFALDGAADGHLGLGFETALQAVDRRARTSDEVAALVHRAGDGGPLLPPEAAEYYRLDELRVDGDRVALAPGFAIVVVTDGSLVIDGRRLPTGSTVLLPHAAGETIVDGTGSAVVARPPLPAHAG